MLFEDVFEEFKIFAEKRQKKQSFDSLTKNFNKHILPYFIGSDLISISKIDIISWQNEILSNNFSNSFNNSLYCEFCSFIDFCILNDYLTINIVKLVGNFPKKLEQKKYDVYNLFEFRKFRNCLKSYIYKQYFNFMYFYGTRPSEAIALRFNDFDGSIVHIRHNIHRRGKRLLDTPKNQSSIRDLRINIITKFRIFILKCIYVKRFGECNDDYFIFGGQKPLSTTSINRYKHNACIKANMREITVHQFRHSYATRMIHKGVPIDIVSRNMGHSKVSTTLDIYLHQEKRAYSPIFTRLNFFHSLTKNFKKLSISIITRFIV